MAERIQKLAELRKLRAVSLTDNRKDRTAEHQRQMRNPKEQIRAEKKRREAEILQERLDTEESGKDYERIRSFNYSAEAVERYEKGERQKAKRADQGFTDYAQVAARKYKKMVSELKPNLLHYEAQKQEVQALGAAVTGGDDAFYRDANSLAYAVIGSKPSEENVNRLVKEVLKQEERRKNFSRRRAFKEDEDVTYINERNMRFNKKVSRAYDKYTKEIKASFERGTAL
ncbi:SYF2 splicing factor-domain-containing protein [Zopfochytrium polystomum]|nr:SYF2 splicing factor-domain-containing protein [Zopfochytrium polystomum]